MIKIKIADATGHQELMVNNQEAEALINKHKESWIFVNNQLIDAADINYQEVEAIEIMPPLIGGVRSLKQKDNDLRMRHLTLNERRLLSTLRNPK
tara:strand:+ start:3724 stop:4008 length:285 start_codon:yes stop_codon:yes gene_type:complete